MNFKEESFCDVYNVIDELLDGDGETHECEVDDACFLLDSMHLNLEISRGERGRVELKLRG